MTDQPKQAGKKPQKSSDTDQQGSEKSSAKALADRPISKLESRLDDGFPLGFPVVGVGASAGGLEAFSELVRNLPAEPNIAVVYVTHLHPDFESALADILARETSMEVKEIKDRMALEANTIYVTRPNTLLKVEDSRLRVSAAGDRHKPPIAIDHFFSSLADDQTSHAIGILLSGTGSDGVSGLKAIKHKDGVAIAQQPSSAKYDAMPAAAIAADIIDLVLTPAEIAVELVRLGQHPYLNGSDSTDDDTLDANHDDFIKILNLLRHRKGNDFTNYKPTTIRRRVHRRMAVHKVEHLSDYYSLLKNDSDELDALFRDLLINVTEFFREPDTFDVLKTHVFPNLLDRSAEIPLRIWVPGCSTGEEAYSIAISLMEYLGDLAQGTPVQIFATDIDEVAIERARAATYPESITQHVSSERLKRYFYRVDNGYQISKPIRDICVFAVQNITKDPPFSHIDLISCRNLLIYLGPVLQRRAIPMFHYALRPQGYLMLGSAESIGSFGELFQVIDQKHRLYIRKDARTPHRLDFSTPASASVVNAEALTTLPPPMPAEDLPQEMDRLIMGRFAPPSVLVDKDFNILLFRGNTGPFLEPVPGAASLNLLRMVRQDLVMELSSMLKEAAASLAEVSRTKIEPREGDRPLRLDVVPMPKHGREHSRFLVVFQQQPQSDVSDVSDVEQATDSMNGGKSVASLEHELANTRDYMRSLIEERESSNEELRSANEEIQSSNEELQSINEELETAKEELQSTNEELATVNDELEARNAELAQVNDDLNNLISSVGIPIIIVGPDLRIRRFTPMVQRLLSLIPTDVGRPIGDIKSRIAIADFEQRLEEVIDRLINVDIEAKDENNRWYSIRMHPYRTLENKIDGAVVAFIDITDLKRGLEWERAGRAQAEIVVRASLTPQILIDRQHKVLAVSGSYLDTFGGEESDIVGKPLRTIGAGLWDTAEMSAQLERSLEGADAVEGFDLQRPIQGLGERHTQIYLQTLPQISDDDQSRVLIQFALLPEADLSK